MATRDWSQFPAVESIHGKVSGALGFEGHSDAGIVIFENLEAGANIDNIMERFDVIDREQVKAVIEFAVRSLDKPPAYVHVYKYTFGRNRGARTLACRIATCLDAFL